MAAVSRNQIIIVSLCGLGLSLTIFLAVTMKEKEPADLPPPANGDMNGGAENATNTPVLIRTNATSVPSTNSPPVTPSTPTGDPLLRALHQKGTLKAALESLAVDHSFDAEGKRQRDILLEAYETFRTFDRNELLLIEPLRALRFIHYTAWISRRWEDPAFKRTFNYYGTLLYWQKEIQDLREQIARIDYSY